jgi:hypothetical protein
MGVTPTKKTASAPQPRPSSTSTRYWWRTWILLTSAGATALGWFALDQGQPSGATVAAPQEQVEAVTLPAESISTPEPAHRRRVTVQDLPSMPQSPVFAMPVTRTRRS